MLVLKLLLIKVRHLLLTGGHLESLFSRWSMVHLPSTIEIMRKCSMIFSTENSFSMIQKFKQVLMLRTSFENYWKKMLISGWELKMKMKSEIIPGLVMLTGRKSFINKLFHSLSQLLIIKSMLLTSMPSLQAKV